MSNQGRPLDRLTPEMDIFELSLLIHEQIRSFRGLEFEYYRSNPTITFREWLKKNKNMTDEEIDKLYPDEPYEA